MESHFKINYKGDKVVGMEVKQVKKRRGKKNKKKKVRIEGESFSSASDFDS